MSTSFIGQSSSVEIGEQFGPPWALDAYLAVPTDAGPAPTRT